MCLYPHAPSACSYLRSSFAMASPNNEPSTPCGQIYAYCRIPKGRLPCSCCPTYTVRGAFAPAQCHRCLADMAMTNANHDHMTGWAFLHDYEMELINLLRPLNLQKKCMAYVKLEINAEDMRRLNEDVAEMSVRPAPLPDVEVAEDDATPYRESFGSSSGDSITSAVSENVADYLSGAEWDDL
jgi:hypothetical protein